MKWADGFINDVAAELNDRQYGAPDFKQALECIKELIAHPCPSYEGTVRAMLEAGHPYLTSIAVELKLLGEI